MLAKDMMVRLMHKRSESVNEASLRKRNFTSLVAASRVTDEDRCAVHRQATAVLDNVMWIVQRRQRAPSRLLLADP